VFAAGCSFSTSDGAVPGGGSDPPPDAVQPIVPDAGCPDDDADGVCNDVDKCAGQDDRRDGDHDGTPDGCDTWKCGAQKPSDPGVLGVVGVGGTATVSFVTLGQGPVATAAPGESLELGYAYGLTVLCGDTSGSCRAQIEYGIGDTRLGCLFDGNVNSGIFKGAINQDADLSAPAHPGEYRVRAKLTASPSGCGNGQVFTDGPPPDSQTIAILCVPPP
jgi:hypothetical protein